MSRYYDLREWRTRVRRQALHDAGYVCQRCGTSLLNMGKDAQVHHRKALKRAPALRSEPLNLMAVCRRCHRIIENEERAPPMANPDGSPADPSHPWLAA